MNTAASFRATLTTHGSTPYVIVPGVVAAGLNLQGRVSVDGTVNGVPFERRSVHPWDDRFFVEIPLRLCRRAGAEVGDVVDMTVNIVADTLPLELAGRLALDPAARVAWEALSSSRQRQLANEVADGRRPDTRNRRAEACVRCLTQTVKQPPSQQTHH